MKINGTPCKEDCLKAELVKLLKKADPKPIYEIDRIASAYGHEILRTPPYHPELQPIETCWGVVKNAIGCECDFSMKGLQNNLETACKKVTPITCRKIIAKIRDVENRFWEEDAKLDAASEDL